MRNEVCQLLRDALVSLVDEGVLPDAPDTEVRVERSRGREHGDFASNLAMVLAKRAGLKPRELAEKICAALPASGLLSRAEVAGPGFINLFLSPASYHVLPGEIRSRGAAYGTSDAGAGRKVMVEFVSANPTGPLHVGHGRGAAYGDALARVLRAAGYDALSEYYINDAGRQMDILALSVWLRYLELCGETLPFPRSAYQGDYIFDIAATLHREHAAQYQADAEALFAELPEEDNPMLDTLISRARAVLGDDGFGRIHGLARDTLVEDIRLDLERFGVSYQTWYSEQSLIDSGAVGRAIEALKETGFVYEHDRAWWFRSSDFGDEKDRVVLRANGNHTYFATDIAYHRDKILRGFAQVINIWGADHHGYIQRVKASMSALGLNQDDLSVLLVQFAVLYRGGEKVSMSTRSGEFVTLRELREEVGRDAARFFYALRKPDQHMDFDLDLAKSQSSDNPVYYVQYAHARICSVFRQLAEKDIDADLAAADHSLLTEPREADLLQKLSRYPEVVESAARAYEPHQVAYYLRELANDFHTYYNAHPFLAAQAELRLARLSLIDATRQVIANALDLLGVTAPERM
ncbi:MAG: arginine--tRNA ligase [Acidiferrobacteraceae bacterium]|jgi:arginyl-tRNA synthetase|nr:arginine--tRNA ligase [Acidiferrobacteraceae bacterium]MDP6552532.1 arginine--tRNA ligase [Arenicellales bacterium]MDP6791691.1 arginine--tRNA ligase [Arenicellales bacterium]MDP6918620.1 arginine--tRNA ligase [Arenicellales bacterium]|tara:strand:+ start:459 stop:2195 length:1737 start_codon:yes stop_codon:yes gene_type:complete